MGMEVYLTQASLGDCILIRCGKEEKKVNILIDSGLSSETFERAINIVNDNKENIDLCIFTHDDNDHIAGAKKLIEKLSKMNQLGANELEKYKSEKNTLFNIAEDRMIFNFGENAKSELLGAEDMHKMIDMLSKEGFDYKKVGLVLADKEENDDGEKKWSNVIQLKWKIEDGNIKSEIIKRPAYSQMISDSEHLEIVILSPDKDILQEYVRKAWSNIDDIKLSSEESKKIKNEWSKSIEYYFANENSIGDDDKLANMASIAFLIKYDGMIGLLSGDAHPDTIIKYAKEYLKNNGFDCDYMDLDFVKLPHHGSSRNINKQFIEFFKTDTYLISTCGSRGYRHPGKVTFAQILKSKNSDNCTYIYTNYAWWNRFEEWQQGDINKIDDSTGECKVRIGDGEEKKIIIRKLKIGEKITKLGGKLTFSM